MIQQPTSTSARVVRVAAGGAWLIGTLLMSVWIVMSLAGCSMAINPADVDDARTAARVKTALVNDPQVGTRAIEVQVARGVVRLSGRVLTEAERARAVELARAVPGVVDVQPLLQIGEVPAAPAAAASEGAARTAESPEFNPNPRLLAVGGSLGWSRPRSAGMEPRVAFSPLFKLGAGRGFGPAIAFDWFQAGVQSLADPRATLTRVRVRPIMMGVGYTVASTRLSISPSLVAGWAFNSLTVTGTGAAEGVPVEVGDSLVWRPGVSVWGDVSRRTAVYVSAGYLMTSLNLTVLEGGRLEKRDLRGDTLTMHVGMAYRLF